MSKTNFDYIVVGAGAAGCAVASRLSEDPKVNVAILEAGPPDRSPLIHMPAGFTKLVGQKVNWGFQTSPQAQVNNREMHYPQGRTLGGSTSINAMIYIRGHRSDYDEWRDLGCEGWGYDEVLPYFKKSENNERFADDYHGQGGPVNVADQTQSNLLTRAFVRSAQQVGIPYTPDHNGATQRGVSYYQTTQRNVKRESAATAYLHPNKNRKNLTVMTNAWTTKVLSDGKKAIGVSYLENWKKETSIFAGTEVIMCAGAVNSPKLLLLSGIGPAEELEAMNIEVVHDLPGVGKNFQDHMDVYIAAECSQPVSYNGEDRWDKAIRHGIQYLMYKTGPVTACVAEAGCFLKTRDGVRSPDIQIHCLPAYVVDHGRLKIKGHGITINTCNLRPKSKGSVTLKTSNPLDAPNIDPNFLGDSDGYDWKTSIEGFRWGRKILNAPAFKEFIKEERYPGVEIQSDEEVKDYIRKWSKTDYHPVGSCKMGQDDMAVVDTQLKVQGMQNLRVIDSSIMPTLISGNTQAPSIMIGEKGAEIIKQGKVV